VGHELRHERFTRPGAPARLTDDRERAAATGNRADERRTGLYWLFLIPFAGLFIPWIFNSNSPELIGIPFFYWYQLAWVPITVALTAWVYRATRGGSR
jgi:hypothetical protein